MRVKLVIKRFPAGDLVGGAEAFARLLAQRLAGLGLDLDVISARYRPEWKSHDWLPMNACSRNQRTGLRLRRLPHPRIRLLGTLCYDASLLFHLLRERRSYDAVWVAFASTESVAAMLGARFAGAPVLCKIAASGPNGDIGQIRRRWHAPLTIRLLRAIDRFVALNREVRADLAAIGVPGDRVVDIPNGVDAGAFSPPRPEERRLAKREIGLDGDGCVIVGVGRLGRQKSWPTLIGALGRLRRERADWHAVILGEGPDHHALLEYARSAGVIDRVTVTSERRDIRRYLRAADVFVLPSLWEGMSNALLEAMSTGLACVCSDIPGNADVVRDGENGLLFPPGNEASLHGLLRRLLGDPAERNRLGGAARECVLDRYHVDRVAERYAAALEALVKGAGAPGQKARATPAREEEPICG